MRSMDPWRDVYGGSLGMLMSVRRMGHGEVGGFASFEGNDWFCS